MRIMRIKTQLDIEQLKNSVLINLLKHIELIERSIEDPSFIEITYKYDIKEENFKKEIYQKLEYVESLSVVQQTSAIKTAPLIHTSKQQINIFKDYNPQTDQNLIHQYQEDIDVVWINRLTGEMFTCVDNTLDNNIWIGQLGTKIIKDNITIEGILSEGLLCYFNFDEMSGNSITSKINNVKLQSDRISLSKKAVNGKSAYFKGWSYGLISNQELFNVQDMTLSYWVNPKKSNWNMNHFWKDETAEFGMYQTWDNYLVFEYGNGISHKKYISTTRIEDNKWTHVTVSRVNGICTFYINGEVLPFEYHLYGSDFTTIGSSWNYVYVGTGSRGGFKGYIDDFYIFNRGLSDSEISVIYNRFAHNVKEIS